MANRSYLYSTNVVPDPEVKKEMRKLTGISEWNYDIPLVYKLLLSSNPQACKSSIWEMPDDIALVGEYLYGVERLKRFLQKIDLPAAQPLIHEVLDFLAIEGNRDEYFVLECGEIFDMGNEPIPVQNAQLLEEIKCLDSEIEKALSSLSAPRESTPDLLQPIYALGLGN